MALCNLCRTDIGCPCNLDVNLLCINCSPNKYIIKEIPIANKNNGNSNIKNKKRKLGYQ